MGAGGPQPVGPCGSRPVRSARTTSSGAGRCATARHAWTAAPANDCPCLPFVCRGGRGSGVNGGRRPSRSDRAATLDAGGRPRNLRASPRCGVTPRTCWVPRACSKSTWPGSVWSVECPARNGYRSTARQLRPTPLPRNVTRPPQPLRRPTFMPEDPENPSSSTGEWRAAGVGAIARAANFAGVRHSDNPATQLAVVTVVRRI